MADKVLYAGRSEAKGVPNLLIAPKDQAIESDEVYDNSRDGYYADGAYIASISSMVPQDAEDSEIDPQDAYYAALLERFQDAASQLRKPSTTPTLDALTIDLLKTLASASYKTWRSTILTETPRPTLLYGLPQEAVLKGLEVLGSLFKGTRKEDHERWRRLGAWVWALLARCRDVSEMSSEEVSTCREMGKKAAWVLRVGQAGVQDEPDINLAQTEEEDCEEGENPAPTDILHEHPDLEPDLTSNAKQGSKAAVATRSPLALSHSVGSTSLDTLHQNTMSVTLDMIVTLVGEMHGQRDLLDARLVWGEENS